MYSLCLILRGVELAGVDIYIDFHKVGIIIKWPTEVK